MPRHRRNHVPIEPLEQRVLLDGDGLPDTTFGSTGTGTVVTDFLGQSDVARGLALETDGKVLAIGVAHDASQNALIGLVRFGTDGQLDPTFGTGGKKTVDFHPFLARCVQVQDNGKIVIGGTYGGHFAVVRVDEDGNPDPGFGNGGLSVLDIPNAVTVQNVLVQPDTGSIVICGNSVVARLTPNGALDTAFGDPTFATPGYDTLGYGPLRALATPGDGTIYAAGQDGGGGVVVHFLENGQLDAGFFAFTTFAPDRQNGGITDMAVAPDGRIVVAGHAGSVTSTGKDDMAVARFNPDGTLDPSFGVDGVSIQSFSSPDANDEAYALAVQTDGKVVVAGSSTLPNVAERQFVVFRLNIDGTLDTSFATNGLAVTDFLPNVKSNERAFAVAVEQEGKIIAAGTDGADFAVARYLGAFANTVGSELRVTGSPLADVISLTTVQGATADEGVMINAEVNGTSQQFPIAAVSRIVVYGFAGADQITVGPGLPGCELRGGRGNDTLTGNAESDTMRGGRGADSLVGGAGNDSLRGGRGNDTLMGGAGDDTLFGGPGDDLMEAGIGDDSLISNDGMPDTLIGGDGTNTATIDDGLDSASGITTFVPAS
jgi:uncharacterized delta-60 repeat protein